MSTAIATRVANGAAWLDEHYPTWWQVIDLAKLNVASCSKCVLGQVFSRAIPAEEQDRILAQALIKAGTEEQAYARQEIAAGYWNGFWSLVNFHQLMGSTGGLGFAISSQTLLPEVEFELLTAEWTRLIIERRINANLAEVTQLWQDNRAEVAALVAA